MFRNPFSRTLTLPFGGSHREFRSPSDLYAALGEMARLSPAYTGALISFRSEALTEQIGRFKTQRRYFHEFLHGLAARENTNGAAPVALDLELVTEDQGWKALMGAVKAEGDVEFLRTTLTRYVEYLDAARELALAIQANRGAMPLQTEPRQAQRFDLNLGDLLALPAGMTDYRRLLKDAPTTIVFGSHQALPMRLGTHEFVLVSADPFLLIDPAGDHARLGRGRNSVGRGSGCDVVLDNALRSVSRTHMSVEITETAGQHRVILTDMSSLGTFLPVREMDSGHAA